MTVNSPRSLEILDAIDGDSRSGSDGPLKEGVRILGNHFNTDRGVTNDRRTGKSLIGGFVKKEWCAPDVQTSHGAKAPQSLASSAAMYHSAAVGASSTASIIEIDKVTDLIVNTGKAS